MALEFWCQTTPTEFWCHGISGAKLHFADVAPLLEFGTKSLAPRLPVLLATCQLLCHQFIPCYNAIQIRDGTLVGEFCRHLCQHHVSSAATAAIVSVVCQANVHGFGGLGGFSAL
ncbi:hypothetical protein Tco_0837415, partial [Tanacetum coccineum]